MIVNILLQVVPIPVQRVYNSIICLMERNWNNWSRWCLFIGCLNNNYIYCPYIVSTSYIIVLKPYELHLKLYSQVVLVGSFVSKKSVSHSKFDMVVDLDNTQRLYHVLPYHTIPNNTLPYQIPQNLKHQ